MAIFSTLAAKILMCASVLRVAAGRCAIRALKAMSETEKPPNAVRKTPKMEDEAPSPHSGTPEFDASPSDAAVEMESDIEKMLIDRLDQAALAFSESLSDYTTQEDAQGQSSYTVPWPMRVEVFKLVRDWVATRRRTDISDADGGTAGVQHMQKLLEQSRKQAENSLVDPKTGLPKKLNGRPTNEESLAYKKLEEARIKRLANAAKDDDSAMRARMAKIQTANGGSQ